MRPMEDAFWIVWCIGGGTPTVRHNSKIAAEREAKRLATVSPGDVFVVMQSMNGYRVHNPVEEIDFTDIPF